MALRQQRPTRMSLRRDIESSLAEAERDLDSPVFGWRNREVACLPNFEDRVTQIDTGGNPQMTNLALLVRRELFKTFDVDSINWDSDLVTFDDDTPIPRSGDRGLTFRGREYKVIEVGWCPAMGMVRFRCADPESNL
jgi:hypothetical protein